MYYLGGIELGAVFIRKTCMRTLGRFAGRSRARRWVPKYHVSCTIPRSKAIRMASVRRLAPSFLSM